MQRDRKGYLWVRGIPGPWRSLGWADFGGGEERAARSGRMERGWRGQNFGEPRRRLLPVRIPYGRAPGEGARGRVGTTQNGWVGVSSPGATNAGLDRGSARVGSRWRHVAAGKRPFSGTACSLARIVQPRRPADRLVLGDRRLGMVQPILRFVLRACQSLRVGGGPSMQFVQQAVRCGRSEARGGFRRGTGLERAGAHRQ